MYLFSDFPFFPTATIASLTVLPSRLPHEPTEPAIENWVSGSLCLYSYIAPSFHRLRLYYRHTVSVRHQKHFSKRWSVRVGDSYPIMISFVVESPWLMSAAPSTFSAKDRHSTEPVVRRNLSAGCTGAPTILPRKTVQYRPWSASSSWWPLLQGGGITTSTAAPATRRAIRREFNESAVFIRKQEWRKTNKESVGSRERGTRTARHKAPVGHFGERGPEGIGTGAMTPSLCVPLSGCCRWHWRGTCAHKSRISPKKCTKGQ